MIVLACALAAACSHSAPQWHEELIVFGTRASIDIRGVERQQAADATAALAETFAGFHRDWHAWEPSALTRINAELAAGRPAEATASIRRLIERAQTLHARTGGLVDIGIGGLVELWGFHTSDYPLTSPPPTPVAIQAWREAAPSVTDLRIDDTRILSRNRAVQLDLGAIAEGLAAESAMAVLRARGIEHALLNLGGDVVALGEAEGRPWRVGVRDPFGDALATVALRDGEGLFASGTYNKFRVDADGQRRAHILDPRTGHPAQGVATAVVVHHDPTLADAAATALVIAGAEDMAVLLDRLGVRCALLVTDGDELWITTGMAARTRLLRAPSVQRQIDRGPDCAPGER